MRLRDRKAFARPEVMIIPMIDIMFFLLVFFFEAELRVTVIKSEHEVKRSEIARRTGIIILLCNYFTSYL